mmetsp:Transcript_40291/g.85940  ORF Transcript_40291/g.85940 Transcript_40291/m.85940 type:complete len:124 (-) Transcript_40291:201-572(-)
MVSGRVSFGDVVVTEFETPEPMVVGEIAAPSRREVSSSIVFKGCPENSVKLSLVLGMQVALQSSLHPVGSEDRLAQLPWEEPAGMMEFSTLRAQIRTGPQEVPLGTPSGLLWRRRKLQQQSRS